MGLYSRGPDTGPTGAPRRRSVWTQDAKSGLQEPMSRPGRDANAGLRSAAGEWHCAGLRLR
ncbi:hypothetical protein ABTI17_19795, partial [Acinetobacter baumannii]